MTAQVCPSPDILGDYLLGNLAHDEAGSIERHLADCDPCLARCDSFDESLDSLVYQLRRSEADDAVMGEPECRTAVENCRQVAGVGTADLGSVSHYRLAEKLGQGGMGTVYRGVHTHLDRPVAVKLMRPERSASSESVARFQREMKAIGKLSHTNIVQALDAGIEDGQYYLVMEHIEGLDAAKLAHRLGQLPVADACEIARQAALGLQYAHENDLVHRDIKPSNLIVTPDGQVKILDLGLALLHKPVPDEGELTVEGQIMGTPNYMAPEQLIQSHAVDHRADIYSLGATLRRLLTGRAPLEARSHAAEDGFRGEVPAELAEIVDRMLAPKRDQRYETADVIAQVLTPFASESDLSALVELVDGDVQAVSAAIAKTASEAIELAPQSESDSSSKAEGSTVDEAKEPAIDTHPEPMPPIIEADPPLHVSRSRRTRLKRQPHRPSKRTWVATAVALLLLVTLGTIFYVTTNNGTLIVEVADDSVEVKLKKHGLVVVDRETKSEYTVSAAGDKDLPPGEYGINVTDDAGLSLNTDSFILRRGDRYVVHIRPAKKVLPLWPPKKETAPQQPPNPLPDSQPSTSVAENDSQLEPTAVADIESTPPTSPMALVTRPAKLPGVKSWSIETIAPRGRTGGHQGNPMAVSPDESLLATTTSDGSIRFYDYSSGKLVGAWPVHGKGALSIAWSADQKFIASLGYDWKVKVLAYPTGRMVSSFEAGGGLSLHWCPHSTILAAGGWDHVVIWSPEEVRRIPAQTAAAVEWSPTDRLLAIGQLGGPILLWNDENRALVHSLDAIGCDNLSWSPDGSKLLSASRDLIVRMWNPHDGKMLRTFGKNSVDAHGDVTWEPDSKSIAVSTDVPGHHHGNQIHFYDVDGEKRNLEIMIDAQSTARQLHWSGDGRTLAICCQSGRICVYDIPEATERYQIRKTNYMNRSHCWSADSKSIICTYKTIQSDWGWANVLSYDLSGKTRWFSKEMESIPQNHFAWSPDKNLLATGGYLPPGRAQEYRVSIVQNGVVVQKRTFPEKIYGVAWANDSSRLAVVSGKELYIWNVLTDELVRQHTIEKGINWGAIEWSPSEQPLAAYADGQVGLLDITTGKPTQTINVDFPVNHIAITSDGKHAALASSENDIIKVFTLSDGKVIRSLPGNHQVRQLQWGPRNEHLTSVCGDGVTKTWDIANSVLFSDVRITTPIVDRYPPHRKGLLSPNGKLLATGSSHVATDWIWDVQRGAPLGSVVILENGTIIQINPNGHYMASADIADEIVYCVVTEDGERLTLSQGEFESRYGWQNDPQKARILLDD